MNEGKVKRRPANRFANNFHIFSSIYIEREGERGEKRKRATRGYRVPSKNEWPDVFPL